MSWEFVVASMAGLVAAVGACGSSDNQGAALGFVVYSQAGTGAVALVDVATGIERVVDDEAPPYEAINVSHDGAKVAYASRVLGLAGYAIVVAEREAGTTRTVGSTDMYPPFTRWLRNGWLTFYTTAGNPSAVVSLAVAGPDDIFARTALSATAVVDQSPTSSLIAYYGCTQGSLGMCAEWGLVVEEPDGSDRRTLASSVSGIARFTPNGDALVSLETSGDILTTIVRPLDGSAPIDIGVDFGKLLLNARVPGTSLFSLDGKEMLGVRGDDVLAARLDGTGVRVVANGPAPIGRAVFTDGGLVLYETESNTDGEFSTLVIDPNGATSLIREGDACRYSQVSPSGNYVAFACYGAPVHTLSDGALVRETGAYRVVGFDRAEEGVVVATGWMEGQIFYTSLTGGGSYLVAEFEAEGLDEPYYDYMP